MAFVLVLFGMTIYDYVWSSMAIYDYVCSCMTLYDYVCLYMTIYDYKTWSSVSNSSFLFVYN